MTTHSPRSAARDLQPREVPPNKENARLIWLDANINDSNDSHHMQDLLLGLNPAAQFYTDLTKCVTFMKSSHDEKILLVVSCTVAQQLLPQVQNLESLAAIFILCENCPSCPKLLDQHSRIVNKFTDRKLLLLSIRDTLNVVEKQLFVFSCFDQKQTSTRELSKESASFIWHQLLIDVLKKMPHDEKAKNDMLTLCSNFYAMNKEQSKEIEKFRKSYKRKKAIPWYTKECFLYKLLNKAIRTEDIELLYLFRFFITDLCDQLKKESEKLKGGDILTLYRGQQIPNEELKKLRQNGGCLISTNGFLSASRDPNVAIKFANKDEKKSDMERCIFEIRVDPSLKSIVFADIDKYSKYREQEVLFGLNAVFKLGVVDMDATLKMLKVPLIATDEEAAQLEEYMRAQEYEMKDYCPMVYFGRILWRDLGRADRAKKYFDMLLKTLPKDHPDISDVYNEIAPLWNEIGDLNLALENYVKGYEIRQRTLQPNHPKISISLNNIGITYDAMHEHDEALAYYWRSLAITKKNTQEKPNQDWALRLFNIGTAYLLKNEYDMAIAFVHQAYDIYKKNRPDQYRDTAYCLGRIGDVYYKKGNIDRALKYYHRQLEMNEKGLSLDHPDISANLQRIACTYLEKEGPEKALTFCKEKLAMQTSTLDENHPRIASTLITIGRLCGGDREYFKQALCILEKCTPKDDLRTIECLKELGDLDLKENNFDDSLAHWMRILDIRLRIHSSDNPKIASTLQNIGKIHFENTNYSEALRYYSESLAVYRANYGYQHEIIVQIIRMIGKIQVMLDSDEEDCKNVVENMEDNLALFRSATDVPTSTTFTLFAAPPNNNGSMKKTKTSGTSYICVLL